VNASVRRCSATRCPSAEGGIGQRGSTKVGTDGGTIEKEFPVQKKTKSNNIKEQDIMEQDIKENRRPTAPSAPSAPAESSSAAAAAETTTAAATSTAAVESATAATTAAATSTLVTLLGDVHSHPAAAQFLFRDRRANVEVDKTKYVEHMSGRI
jgi:hypothetical protein